MRGSMDRKGDTAGQARALRSCRPRRGPGPESSVKTDALISNRWGPNATEAVALQRQEQTSAPRLSGALPPGSHWEDLVPFHGL